MKEFKLDKIPKIETGFKTPDNYFENFSGNFMKNLPENKTNKNVISLFDKRKNLLFMAAAILIIALLLPILFTNSKTTSNLETLTIENYLSYQSNLNQYDLIDVLEYDKIDNMEASIDLDKKTIEDILTSNSNLEILIED
jgi:hypothetical protein